MMIPRPSIVLLFLASVPSTAIADLYEGGGSGAVPALQKRRSVQGMDQTPAPSPAKLGTSYCTDAPDTACYPSTNGIPACCRTTPDECPTEKQPCENSTSPTASGPTAPTDAPAPTSSMPGESYCTYAPDFTCYKGGWPACCLVNLTTCPTAQPTCDRQAGASYCTDAPDYDCYVDGWPMCCQNDGGADCPAEQPSCDDASDVPSMVPTPATSGGGVPSALPTPERLGSSYCTNSPDLTCYPSTNGFPACCESDPTACPAAKPDCESSAPTANNVSGPTTPAVVPSPSPVASSPTPTSGAVAGVRSSSPLALAAAAIVGAAIANIGANY